MLLSLSPLHRQLLPPPEQAWLCPSSFGRTVGKLLMQHLGLQQIAPEHQHDVGQPDMWHVWWHIGLRRYHWLKQQQQQQDGGSVMGCVPAWCQLSAAQLEQLYQDPAAR